MTHSIGTTSRRAISLGLTLLLLIFAATAQNQTDQTASSAPQPTVKLNVLVLDESKRGVNDVKQDEIRISEDGVEQKISLFERDIRPLSYGLMLDASGSLRKYAEQIPEAGGKFIRISRPEDEGFVMRFVNRETIEMLHDFSPNKSDLLKSLDDYYIEGGQTAFVDAVYLAVQRFARHKLDSGSEKRRRVLVLISDGDDRDSYYKRDQLVKLLRENDVQIFAIGLVEELDEQARELNRPRDARKRATELLDRLAAETGGRVYYPRSAKEMMTAIDDISNDLQTQYLIGYNPSPNPNSKSYRKIKVSLVGAKETRGVIAPPGYTPSNK